MGAAYIVLLSTNVIRPVGFGQGYTVEEIHADTVVLRHEFGSGNDNAVVYDMVTITDSSTIKNILAIHDTMRVTESFRKMDRERYALYFYQKDELVELWRLDTKGLTSFTTRKGVYSVENDDFDFDYIKGLVK